MADQKSRGFVGRPASTISDENYFGLVAKDFEKSHGNNLGSSYAFTQD